MFEHLTSQFRREVETVQRALNVNEGLRNLLILQNAALASVPAELPATADAPAQIFHRLAELLPTVPDKLDWQIYDHCAALTRLYAVYEQFVGGIVNEYVGLLPKLYTKYLDLPSAVTVQHRSGIGQILFKMGDKGLYKNLDESVIVRELATAVGGSSAYTLLPDAFFVDRQNLRYEVLCRLLSKLGLENTGKFINKHPAVIDFIKKERADNSSPLKELEQFIDYRNEAAHRKVENVLANDAIGAIGRFLIALSTALADLIERGVLMRRMELGHYYTVMAVSEVHHGGSIVIGIPPSGIKVLAGDEIIIMGRNACCRASLESLQLDDQPVQEFTGDGAREIGIRLSKPAPENSELRVLQIPAEIPSGAQLTLEEVIVTTTDDADTDSIDVSEIGPDESDTDLSNQ